MSRTQPLSLAVRRALYGTAIASVAASGPVFGQDQREEVLEEIITTGSRIAMDANLLSSSPVTTVNADEIVKTGITRVENLVNDLPQMVPEFTANDSNGSTGTATLDLRGLGSDRTLVLTNGHRMGFGDPFALAPDINQIPGNLVERIEILTGGASSVYGADAVAGVVNFVMKDDYEGFELDYQYSGYYHDNDSGFMEDLLDQNGYEQAPGSPTDGEAIDITMIMGVNSGDGRGNVTAYLGYRDINAVQHGDRDYSACALSSGGVGETCAGSATIPTGLFSPFNGVDYFTVEGDQFIPWDYSYYNYGPLNYFQRPDERITAGVFGHYEVSPGIEAYTEIMYMDDRTTAQIAPSGNFFRTSSISCDNVLLSAQQLGTLGCTDTSTNADGSAAQTAPFYIGRRNVEGGPRFDDLRHTNWRGLLGFRGDIGDNWTWDVSGNFSRLRYSQVYQNDLSITRIARAIDVVDDGTGTPVCRTALSGVDSSCVPWNIYQTDGVTPAALNYITLPLFAKADLEQDQYVAFVTGDLTDAGVALPTADDGVKVVLGFEYREDTFEFNPDQGFTTGDGAGQGGPTPGVIGTNDVTEFFTEVKIPLVEGRTGFESLSLDLRYRYSDYDLGGTTDTYNYGGEWTPVEDIMVRGGFSRAVRAPNIRELFQPTNIGLWAGNDPCAGATPVLSQAECANTGVSAAQYGTVPASPAGQYNAIFGGNPQLDVETSDSTTIGAVWTPSGGIFEGLTISFDYWDIEVDDAIAGGLGEEFTINQCAATGDATFCDLIQRGPNGNLWIQDNAFVVSTDLNIGFFEVKGYDISVTYPWAVADGHDLDFNYRGSILDSFEQQPIPGGPVDECKGTWGGNCGRPRPEYKHTFYTTWSTPWDLGFTLGWRHVGDVDEFGQDRYTADSQDYFDLSGIYTTELWDTTTTISFGLNNVADEEPPFNGLINNASFSNGNTFPGSYDALGRYWFVGVNIAL